MSLQGEIELLKAKRLSIIEAIENEGSVQKYHRQIMAKHRKEWPKLWEAIDWLLIDETEEKK